MNVLITGGAGYIGSHVNRLFLNHGADTTVLDDLSSGHSEAVVGGEFIKGDMGDAALLDGIFSRKKFDAVAHFAAFIDVGESVPHPDIYYENNVVKMKHLIDAAVRHGVRYFVFSSTAAIFGEPVRIPIDEDHPKTPVNPYGWSKLMGEVMLSDYEKAYGIRSCSFRYFNAAGASSDGSLGESHSPEHHLIPLVLRAVSSGREMSVFGDDYDTRDGSCIRDYVHVEDLASAHWQGLRYIMDHDESEAFNLGSGEGFSVMELIAEAERVTGKDVPRKIAPRRAGDPAVLIASNAKAKKMLGWEPVRSSLPSILADVWNWEQNRRF